MGLAYPDPELMSAQVTTHHSDMLLLSCCECVPDAQTVQAGTATCPELAELQRPLVSLAADMA
jgi:hypothetical protein